MIQFQVELLSFTDCEGGNRDWYKMPESEKRECDFRIRLKAALREKEYGKEQFEVNFSCVMVSTAHRYKSTNFK